jgi:TldD protein
MILRQNHEEIFSITTEEISRLLNTALSKGGEFAELFFEYRISSSVLMEEDIIKSSSENIIKGVGIRVINGLQTGYAYSSDLNFDKISKAALTAATIANTNSKFNSINLDFRSTKNNSYDLILPLSKENLQTKIELVKKAYSAALNYDSKITKVSCGLGDELQFVTIANSNGLLISDLRPQTRLGVTVTADDGKNRTTGFKSAGGRVGMGYFTDELLEGAGKASSEEAIILLDAVDAPSGEQVVVLSNEQSGVLIHEAIGHPLEADSVRKGASIMTGKLNEMVANPIVSIIEDPTIPELRGSLNIDDEGTETEKVVLVEHGKLVGFMNDYLSAKALGHKMNGHARRESFSCSPIPRMNNTILLNGESTAEEIISSVKSGFFAKSFQGGMVNSTGKFTFSVNLGYMIEDGKLTQPIKNTTLIGSNIEILKRIDMVGDDMGFFLGSCGKDGQTVPVTCGTPTLRISKMTVGGTR